MKLIVIGFQAIKNTEWLKTTILICLTILHIKIYFICPKKLLINISFIDKTIIIVVFYKLSIDVYFHNLFIDLKFKKIIVPSYLFFFLLVIELF